MARVNPEVERLQRMVEIYKRTHERMLADPGDVPFVACDHSCVCVSATGVATNGGCRCDERKLRRAVQYWRRRAQFLQITIQTLREAERGAPEIREHAWALRQSGDEAEAAAFERVAEYLERKG